MSVLSESLARNLPWQELAFVGAALLIALAICAWEGLSN